MVKASFGSELILAALLDEMHTLVHFTLKAHVKHAVSLINDDVIEVGSPIVRFFYSIFASYCTSYTGTSLALATSTVPIAFWSSKRCRSFGSQASEYH